MGRRVQGVRCNAKKHEQVQMGSDLGHGQSMDVAGPIFPGRCHSQEQQLSLCGEHDSGGHVLGSCSHPEMKNLHIYHYTYQGGGGVVY